MGFLRFARGAFTYLGVHVGKRSGLSTAAAVRGCSFSQDSGKSVPGQFTCCPLPHRALLRIEGADTSAFLQGLITNDMGALDEPEQTAAYSHMLNVQGRTLYDILLFRMKEAEGGGGVFLECDSTLQDSVLKHLKVYKIRRKVNISLCPELSVWAVLCLLKDPNLEDTKPELRVPEQVVLLEPDPRTSLMGWRLVLRSGADPSEVIASCRKGDTEDYHKHRYCIGVPEGVKDLPPGVALPLESNLVYLKGISFSKGCYIGQELTARTHYTGVLRKRLMPVRLSAPVEDPGEGAALHTQAGKPAGKHRAGVGQLGLSLIRVAHAKETLTLRSSDGGAVTLEASVPDWWPKDEKII